MSLYGALFSGVSGLSAQSAAMGAISDNISNVNTVGYKDTSVNFQTLVTHQVSLTDYSPGGVQSKPRTNVDTQGLLQATSSTTDIAISGSGFFVVNSVADPLSTGSGEFAYTRAGSFKVDKDGYLQNVAGWYMQGWPLTNWDGTTTASHQTINGSDYMAAYKNSSGSYTYINTGVVDPTNLRSLNLNDIAGTAASTTSIRMGANLPSSATVGTTEKTNLLDYDSLGNSHNVLVTWTKVGQNSWSAQATPPQGARTLTLYDNRSSANTPQIYQTAGRLDFDQSPTSGDLTMTINGNTWNFVVGSGTNGTPANTMYAVGYPTITDVAQFAQTMATDINQAYLTEYSGSQMTPVLTGGGGTTFVAGSTIDITGPGGTVTGLDLSGDTLAQAAAAIDAKYVTTGVHAYVNGTSIAFYTDKAGQVTIANGANDAAGLDTVFSGTGLSYASQVAGTGGVVFNNYDTAHTVTISGLTSVLAGAAPASIAAPLAYPQGTLTVSGPSGTAAVDLTATATVSDVITAINAATGTTGVGCYLDPATGNIDFYTTTPGTVSLSDSANVFPTAATTFSSSGTMVVEQTGVTTTGSAPGNPDTFALSKVAPVVYSGTAPTTVNAPNTPAIVFNGNGTPQTINVGSMAITWANGSQDQTTKASLSAAPPISLFFGSLNQSDGMTQLAGNYQLTYMNQNGAKFGNFSGLSVGTDGIVTALFDNGVTRPIFQIPVATFVNPDGMQAVSGNVYIASDFSGLATLRVAGTAGSGTTQESSLEASTVDIGTQFTTMIVTQRAYSAAAKIITTADQMLDDLINIKR